MRLRFLKPHSVLRLQWPRSGDHALMVPANRLGYGQFTGYQLKIIQEAITLVVFVVFAWTVLGEKLKWNYVISLLCLGLAVFFAFGVNRTPSAVG